MSYQINDVVEALVREYLVRAGCTGALETFNREKPKHANSITKREVLRKSLGLDKAFTYYKKQNPTAEGLPSTLEVWVIHQIAKLSAAPPAEQAAGPAQMPAPRPAPAPLRTGRAATEPDEVSVPMAAPGLQRRPASGSGVIPAAAASAASGPAPPGAVASWRQRGVNPLRKGSGRSRSKRSMAAAAKVPVVTAAAAAAMGQRPPAGAAPPTANRSRRSLARPPSIVMPRLAPVSLAAKPQAAAQASSLPPLLALPPVRGAARLRPPSHKNLQHPHPHPHPQQHPHGHPHSHPHAAGAAAATGPAGGYLGAAAAAHPHAPAHGHPHAAAAAVGSRAALPMPCISTPPHKARPAAAAAASTAGYPGPFTNTRSTSPSAASPCCGPAAAASPDPATFATTESDLRDPRRMAMAASSPGQGGQGRPAPVRQGFGFGEGPAGRPAAPAAAPAPRRGSVPSNNNDSDEEPEIIHSGTSTRGSSAAPVRASQPGAMHHSASASGVSMRASAPGVGGTPPSPTMARSSSGASAATAPAGGAFTPPRAPAGPAAGRPLPAAAGLRPGAGASRGHGLGSGEMVMEDVDDISFGDDDDGGAPAAAAGGLAAMRISGPATRKPGAPISPDVLRQLKQLLWGGMGQPPPSWKQGFFFNRHSGLQFGLLQKQGGPCGVLAGLQALILAALHSPSTGFNTTPRAHEQQSALAAAITESLWQARMGPTAALVLPEGEAGGAGGRLGYDQLARAVAQHTATNKEAMLDLVRGSLSVLMAEDGWGVVLFVMSLALSRGVDNIRADMDEPNNSLMGMHGYCTQELVNLIILGVANSNVFDGNKQLDGSTVLKGVSRRCRVGMLTLFEWYKYVEVGPSLKNPGLPVWVICSESHFTVLFAQDGRALADQLPFDLFYYDELANQESVIRLSVARDPRGGWSARVGSTFGDRGKCEGQNIPPLECVIETRWPGVKVNWNGHDPIL